MKIFFFRPPKCSLVSKLSTLSNESYNKTLSSDRIRGPTRPGKALNWIYKSFLSFLRKHACLRSRNDSHSQFSRSPLGTPGTPTPFCVLNMKKNGLQIMNLAPYASETNNSSLRRFSSHRQDALSASLPTSHHRLNRDRQPR